MTPAKSRSDPVNLATARAMRALGVAWSALHAAGWSDEQAKPLEKKRARHAAIWIAKQIAPDVSLPALARASGLSDHTTVLHAIRSIESCKDQRFTRSRAEPSTSRFYRDKQ